MSNCTDCEKRTRAGSLGKFLGYFKARRETVGNSEHLTAAQVNARPLVGYPEALYHPNYNLPQTESGPQQAPDPIRQSDFDGLGHLGKARIPKFVSAYDQTAWESQGFVSGHNRYAPGADIPFGNMTPEQERANIQVPDNIAYGSSFVYQPTPYGYV